MRAKVYELFEKVNVIRYFTDVFNTLVDAAVTSFGKDDPELVNAMGAASKAMIATKMDEMIDGMVEVYQKHYTEEDIDAMLAYHNSAVGQKVAAVAPLVEAECKEVGNKFGIMIGAEIDKRLEEMTNEVG
jgi:hypothetical protein